MGVVYLAYCGSWQMYLVSVLFISSIPHLTPYILFIFSKMFLYLFTVFFLKQECMCVRACMHACVCISLVQSSSYNLGAVKT